MYNNKLKKVLYIGKYNEDYCRNYTFIKALRQNRVSVFEINLGNLSKKNKIKLLLRKLRNLKTQKIDLIIFYSQETFAIPFLIARLFAFIKKIPFINDIFISKLQTYYSDRNLSIIKKRIKIKLYYWFYYYLLDFFESHLSNYIILDTLSHIKFFHEKFRIPLRKFRKIYVGVREDIFFPIKSKEKNEKIFKVGFWGTYIPLHGVKYIIQAAKILENEKDIKIFLIGNGLTFKENKILAINLDVNNIEFLPEVFLSHNELPRLAKLLSTLDIGLGIFGESEKVLQVIPNKIFEGIAMKLPMITSNTPAINELFTNDKNIALCERSDPTSLVKTIMRLKNDEKLREQIRENAYNIFIKYCSSDAISQKLIKTLNMIYKGLMY